MRTSDSGASAGVVTVLEPGLDAGIGQLAFAQLVGEAAGRADDESRESERRREPGHDFEMIQFPSGNDQGEWLKRLLLATRNANKKREISELLRGLPIEVQTLDVYPEIPE